MWCCCCLRAGRWLGAVHVGLLVDSWHVYSPSPAPPSPCTRSGVRLDGCLDSTAWLARGCLALWFETGCRNGVSHNLHSVTLILYNIVMQKLTTICTLSSLLCSTSCIYDLQHVMIKLSQSECDKKLSLYSRLPLYQCCRWSVHLPFITTLDLLIS